MPLAAFVAERRRLAKLGATRHRKLVHLGYWPIVLVEVAATKLGRAEVRSPVSPVAGGGSGWGSVQSGIELGFGCMLDLRWRMVVVLYETGKIVRGCQDEVRRTVGVLYCRKVVARGIFEQ